MSETTETDTSFHVSEDDQLAEYRAVSGLAIVGLLLGFASPLAMWRLLFLGVPAAAVFVCLLALSRIHGSEGRLFGRSAAILGLCLAIFFIAVVPARTATRSHLIAGHARPLADQFFELLTTKDPQKALQLTKMPDARRPLDAQLWDYYRGDMEARRELKNFVELPLIHSLLALGNKAQIRFYENGAVRRRTSSSDIVTLIYAVTFNRMMLDAAGRDGAGQKISFFVTIELERKSHYKDGIPRWRVTTFDQLKRRDAH